MAASSELDRSAFVTGGSGFVGGALIRRLVGEGWSVRALARSDGSARKVEALGATAVRSDLDDRDALRAGAEGCAFAFHAAAHVEDDERDWETFERVNVKGTENVLAACREAGVRRFVHVGTEAALLVGQPLVHADETVPLRPDSPVPYSATKARAEAAVLAANEDGAFETVVVRPRFIWGVGDTTLLPQLVEQCKTGKLMWIGGGEHRTSTSHIDNVVEGLVAAGLRGRPGNAYFVLDDGDVAWKDFIGALVSTQGVEPPTRNLPKAVGAIVVRLPRSPLGKFAYWLSTQECTLDDAKIRRDTGYAPVKSREQGLAELRAAG